MNPAFIMVPVSMIVNLGLLMLPPSDKKVEMFPKGDQVEYYVVPVDPNGPNCMEVECDYRLIPRRDDR